MTLDEFADMEIDVILYLYNIEYEKARSYVKEGNGRIEKN